MRKLYAVLFVLLLTVTGMVMAQDEGDMVHLRVAHFAVDAPAVDVYIDGDVAISNLDFPEVTEWMQVAAGTYEIAVAPAGTSLDNAVIGPAEFTLPAGEWLTIAAIGLVGNDTLTAQVLTEDYSMTADGETRISVFHAIADAPPVDVFANGNALVRVLAYPGTVVEGGDGLATVDVVAGTYDVEVTLQDGTEVFAIDEITMGAGRHYFIAAVGTAADPQFRLVTSDISAMMMGDDMMNEDDMMDEADLGTGNLVARIGHFAPAAPEVDVYLNGEAAVTGLSFPEITGYVELSAGIYDVALVPAGGTLEDAVLTTQVALAENTVNLVAAIGLVEQGTLTVAAVQEEAEAPATGETRLAVFQTIPSLNAFNLTANDITLVQGLFYPEVFEGAGDGFASVDVIAGTYNIGVEAADGSIDLNVGEITMGGGRSYLVVVVGTESTPLYLFESTDFPNR